VAATVLFHASMSLAFCLSMCSFFDLKDQYVMWPGMLRLYSWLSAQDCY